MIIKNNNTFHLQGKDVSYIISVSSKGDLLHVYYGKKIGDVDFSNESIFSHPTPTRGLFEKDDYSLENYPLEYPSYGHLELTPCAYSYRGDLGHSNSRLKFKSYKITDDVPVLEGLPGLLKGKSTPSTLTITLSDEIQCVDVELSYLVYEEYNIIARSAFIRNTGEKALVIDTAYSSSLDLPVGNYDVIYFAGAWARERDMFRVPITQQMQFDLSNAEGNSGHALNPFIIVCDNKAQEDFGDVYGMSLIYSGNHSQYIACDSCNHVRVMQGINPFKFEWTLKVGEAFQTPQSVTCYSPNGIGGMSRDLNDVYRNNLCRSKFSNMPRPILLNNWEGTYFNFDEQKIVDLAKVGAELGVELFVLDDGWFGHCDDDTTSLGDWTVDYKKLPNGIDGLAKKINDLGIKFGLWFEPETISIDSDIYRAHPDWAVGAPNTPDTFGRNELLIDLANSDVCDYIVDSISNILENANVEYIKWDMNRSMGNMPYYGYNHKFYLGLYSVFERLTKKFPDVLFEGCCSGGGRFDAGILAYMPQTWASDNSDAFSRLRIQYSTSIGYPVSSIGQHVTASPNHQVHHSTPLKTRFDVAFAGVFGYELDVINLLKEELEEIKAQITLYKKYRDLIYDSDMYRLMSPFEDEIAAWELVAKDKSKAFFMACNGPARALYSQVWVKLKGLDENAIYIDETTGNEYRGDVLMNIGIKPKFDICDYASFSLHLTRK